MFQNRTFLKWCLFERRAQNYHCPQLASEGGPNVSAMILPPPLTLWLYDSISIHCGPSLRLCLSFLVFLVLLMFLKSVSALKCHDVNLYTSFVDIKDFRPKLESHIHKKKVEEADLFTMRAEG